MKTIVSKKEEGKAGLFCTAFSSSFLFIHFYFALNTATFSLDRSILSGMIDTFLSESDDVNPAVPVDAEVVAELSDVSAS